MSVLNELERLLNTLGAAVAGDLDALAAGRGERDSKGAAEGIPGRARAPGDAIEAILASPDRTTAVQSLRESEVVEAFRGELADGLIRVDTANRLLRLVNEVVVRLL